MPAWLTIKPLLWICAALVLACASLTTVIVVKDARHKATVAQLQSEKDTCANSLATTKDSLATAEATNGRQQLAVAALAGKLDIAIRETERLDKLLTEAETDLAATRKARDRALAALEVERENVYATDPSCAAWGAAPVCAGLTGSLQEHWRSAAEPRPD